MSLLNYAMMGDDPKKNSLKFLPIEQQRQQAVENNTIEAIRNRRIAKEQQEFKQFTPTQNLSDDAITMDKGQFPKNKPNPKDIGTMLELAMWAADPIGMGVYTGLENTLGTGGGLLGAAIPLFGGLRKPWKGFTRNENNITKVLTENPRSKIKIPLEDNVYYSMNNGIKTTNFDNIPMFDWDFPNVVHKMEKSVTKKDLGDVVGMLNNKMPSNMLMDLYLTPGGVHGFPVSATGKMTANSKEYDYFSKLFKQDPYYSEISKQKNQFNVRISPKPPYLRHPNDEFITSYIGSVGQGTRNPELTKKLEDYVEIPSEYILSDYMKYYKDANIIPNVGYEQLRDNTVKHILDQIKTVKNPNEAKKFFNTVAPL